MGIKMNHREREGLRLTKTFPLIYNSNVAFLCFSLITTVGPIYCNINSNLCTCDWISMTHGLTCGDWTSVTCQQQVCFTFHNIVSLVLMLSRHNIAQLWVGAFMNWKNCLLAVRLRCLYDCEMKWNERTTQSRN